MFVTLMVTVTTVIAFLSAFGWITPHQHKDFTFKTTEYYRLHPVPLSFPFYALTSIRLPVWPLPFDLSKIIYQINFLTFEIISINTYYSSFTLGTASICYSFFLLVNIIGVIIGYWMSKIAFTWRLFAKRS